MSNPKRNEFKAELLKRTIEFSDKLISLINKLPKNTANLIIFKQIIRSGTSIGANYREACEAESAKDFIHKIRISKKEAQETSYWLELLVKTNPKFDNFLIKLNREVIEFVKIFAKISSKF